MNNAMARSQPKISAIAHRPASAPPPADEAGCFLTFGHNAGIQKVLMQFSAPADRLIFTPAEARMVAQRLTHEADAVDKPPA
jgi:hypothetical protein